MATKSTTRVFKVRDYRNTAAGRDYFVDCFFFRGHRWEVAVWCPLDDYVSLFVTAIPCWRLRKYAQTTSKAKISVEILDRSGRPAVFANTVVGRKIELGVLVEKIHVERKELHMSSCISYNSFTFRCTVSEDDVPLGIFYKLRLKVTNAGIFSKLCRR